MNHADSILRAARDMKEQARAHKAAGEPTPINPDAVLELAEFMEARGRDLNAAGRYGGTDEPDATRTAYDIARAYFGETA